MYMFAYYMDNKKAKAFTQSSSNYLIGSIFFRWTLFVYRFSINSIWFPKYISNITQMTREYFPVYLSQT